MTPDELVRHGFGGKMAYPLWASVAWCLLAGGLVSAIIACWLVEGVPARALLIVAALLAVGIGQSIRQAVSRCPSCSGPVGLFWVDLDRDAAVAMVAQAQQLGVRLRLPRDGWFRVCERFRVSGEACPACRLLYRVGIEDPDAPSAS